MEMLVELIEFDRPHRLGSRTTSPMMETTGTLTCTSEVGATRLSWDWQVHPKGWFKHWARWWARSATAWSARSGPG